jgi:ATP-dependent Lon protease
VKSGLEIVPVSRMEEVLAQALVRQPQPIVWDETAEQAAQPVASDDEGAGMVAH